jgi:hypothetical protein
MKGITKKLIQTMALVAVFGLASCTTTPVNDDTTGGGTSGGGSTGGGTSGGGSTGGGTGGGSTAEGYVVQLIASKSASKAESIKNEFAGEGYNKAHVSALGDVFRVQIGPYGSEADAQRVLNQMRRRYKRNENVNNAVVKTVNGS